MKHGRIDANQSEIVEALRMCGCTVFITSDVGDGFPDLVVGHRGLNFLLEVKDGDKPPSARQLTEAEDYFHYSWLGQVDVVKDIDEAFEVVGVDYE